MPEIKSVVTERTATKPSTVVDMVVMPWWQIVLVRTGRTYLQGMLGFLSAGITNLDMGIMPNDFVGILSLAAQLSIAPAVFTLLQNILELLMKLDVSRPSLRA